MEEEFTNLMAVQDHQDHVSEGNGSESDESDHFEVPPPTTVNHVRDNVTSVRFAQYLQQFDLEATKESVVFASLPVASIDDGNRAQTLAMGIEKEDEVMQHQNDLDHIDLLKRRRIAEIDARRRRENAIQQRRLRDLKVKSNLTTELVETYYSVTAQELDIHLTARQVEVLQSVGEIRKFDRGDYDPDKPDWSSFEQQVELRVVSVRGLKNKVPRGEYIMMISKWDKMGGTPMRWSTRTVDSKPPPPCPLHQDVKNMSIRRNCEICRGWAGATMPSVHRAGQKDYELPFDNRIFTFFPSERRIKPYMALIFELIQLPKRRQGQPKVVGWSALPCVDSQFQIINGKFRFPLVRGAYTQKFLHHADIMNYIYDDIENWIGNAYIDIFPHPREHHGRGEFTLQSEFTNNLLRLNHYPSAKEGDGWPIDGRKRGNSFDASSLPQEAVANFGGVSIRYQDDSVAFPYERPEVIDYEETPSKTFWGIIRKAVLDKAKINARNAAESQREAVKRAEQQKTFRFSIHPHGTINLESVWRTQVEYCVRGILDELSLRHPEQPKFYLNILAFFIALYFQVFVHGAVLFTSLSIIGVPVLRAYPHWTGLLVDYSQQNTTSLQEFYFVFWAELACLLLLLALIGVGVICRTGTGNIPDHLSKFVYTIGLTGFLVPWYELIVDAASGTVHGDIMRLHTWFTIHDYGAYFGYLVFGIVYFFIVFATIVSIFLYTMRLHLNGILQDAYWRIMIVNEDTYTIPDDLEISIKELKHILSSAERWRGMNGERRKISVQKIITTDDEDPEYKRVDLSIVVKQLQCKTSQEWMQYHSSKVFRSFFVMHTGAILEVLNKEVPSGLAFALTVLNSKKQELPDLGESLIGQKSVAFY
jgi:hypothetical protein